MGELNKVREAINRRINKDIECSEWHNSIVLEGTVDSYDEVVAAGLLAANRGYKGVVNKISVRGAPYKPIKIPQLCDRTLDGKRVDVLIIGGGITGTYPYFLLIRRKTLQCMLPQETMAWFIRELNQRWGAGRLILM